MRELARARHDDPKINWRDDRLPALKDTFSTGLSFDVILVSAVWMHLAPTGRPRAFRKLITLLKPGGLLAITLREGPDDENRGFHPVTVDELRRLATRSRCVCRAGVDGRRPDGPRGCPVEADCDPPPG